MATATFYEAASRIAKTPEVRALMSDLLERAQERDQLQAEFARQVLTNRARREGKPAKISKEAEQWHRESKEHSHTAIDLHDQRIAKLTDEQLLSQALNGWDLAVQLHNPSVYHEDDREFAERIDRHNRQALRHVKWFYRRRGLPIPTHKNSGISFIVAFQRAIPDMGTLGGDCMAIEPTLPALDKLAATANVPSLSSFVNPDPERLSGSDPEWFDAEAGLKTVRGLLAELKQNARAIKNTKKVAEDLALLEKDLERAKQKKVKFNFVMLD
jgi:hypothetical protein